MLSFQTLLVCWSSAFSHDKCVLSRAKDANQQPWYVTPSTHIPYLQVRRFPRVDRSTPTPRCWVPGPCCLQLPTASLHSCPHTHLPGTTLYLLYFIVSLMWTELFSVKSFNFVGTKFHGLTTLDMFIKYKLMLDHKMLFIIHGLENESTVQYN